MDICPRSRRTHPATVCISVRLAIHKLQGKQRRELRRVLGKPLIPNLGETELAFDDSKAMLDLGPHTGLEPLDLVQHAAPGGMLIRCPALAWAHRHKPAHASVSLSQTKFAPQPPAPASDFLTELGRDFCYIGTEYPVQVGGQDFALDLLFFHRGLNCLVAIELKVTAFEPEHLGKLNFYLEALDRDHHKPHENPAIGVPLCASKDSEVVEYALSRSLSPVLVAGTKRNCRTKKIIDRQTARVYALNVPGPDEKTARSLPVSTGSGSRISET